MNNNSQHIVNETLIAKYLEGAATSNEQLLVEEWRNESELNEKEFEQYKAVWLASESINHTNNQQFDANAAWKKINPRLSSKKAKIINLRPWYGKAAIVFALCLLGYLTVNYLLNDENRIEIYSSFEKQTITLPDQSVVTLNKNSKLTYADSYSEKNRIVYLEGEAFFDVQHQANLPFIVKHKHIEVTVLGTQFYLNETNNSANVEVSVVKGKVAVKANNDEQTEILTKGEKVDYSLIQKVLQKSQSENNNQQFWNTGELTFQKVRLNQLFAELEKHYQTKIAFEEDSFNSCLFSGRFNSKSVEEILEQVKLSYEFSIQKTDSSFQLFGNPECE